MRTFQRFPTSSAASSSNSLSPSVDVEMLFQFLILQSVEVVVEFKDYIVQSFASRNEQIEEYRAAIFGAGSRLRCWLQQGFFSSQAKKTNQLFLLQPAVHPLQCIDNIYERFDDVKTQLQLVYAAVDQLQTIGEHNNSNICHILKQLKQNPTCCCKCNKFESIGALTTKNAFAITKENRLNETQSVEPQLQLDRFELPMQLFRPSAALQEDSSAILYRIIKSVDSRDHTIVDDDIWHQIS
ncbi:uncharacterized protein PHALS_09509 [Plasmopara halstedii]|uniref:Uncharacterized protein n=1 Tax=Plasmopara halstedii TaxID=4781 RepID=A0A0N7L3B2_PLAHL|nr:uncharacterized protein PHALS_09509 [Plasmopara halstedii]CEG35387.1 hypothetical protein PHALS_09509 [Plasmopara halstedii]|eukprot:XP_024571756.1 hypothetical protein PHALS_09509 [Plasmopara halstedii]